MSLQRRNSGSNSPRPSPQKNGGIPTPGSVPVQNTIQIPGAENHNQLPQPHYDSSSDVCSSDLFPISTMDVTISKMVSLIRHYRLESRINPWGIRVNPVWTCMAVTTHSIRIPGLMIPIHNRWVPLEGLPLRGPIEICRMIRWGMGDLAVQMWIMDHPMTHRMM